MAGVAEPPEAVVRGCAARISGGSISPDDGDTIIGPLRFNMQSYSPLPVWRRLVRDGQWMKSVARVRAGAQVTLVVPPEQRPWMRLAYAHRRRGGKAAVTLRACRHRRSRAARRRECVWADYTACRSGPTFFSGGFEIDYDEAPQQGRCAELIVWVKGEQEPHRVRLLLSSPASAPTARRRLVSATPTPDERTRYSSRREDEVEIRAWPEFDEEVRGLLESVGDVIRPEPGETLWDAGDAYDLYLVLAGGICLVDRRDDRVGFVVEAGDFVGELGMLMGQPAFLAGVAMADTAVLRVRIEDLNRLMATSTELSDVLLSAFDARRRLLTRLGSGWPGSRGRRRS